MRVRIVTEKNAPLDKVYEIGKEHSECLYNLIADLRELMKKESDWTSGDEQIGMYIVNNYSENHWLSKTKRFTDILIWWHDNTRGPGVIPWHLL